MDNKYEELEKWKILKENGTISEEEFEIEKYNILNTKNINKNENNKIKNNSKIFFIITGILIGITIIFVSLYLYFNNELYKESMKPVLDELNAKTDVEIAEQKYNQGKLSYSEYKKIQKEFYEEYEKKPQIFKEIKDISFYISCFVGIFSIIFLTISIIFKIKEKGGIKIVN